MCDPFAQDTSITDALYFAPSSGPFSVRPSVRSPARHPPKWTSEWTIDIAFYCYMYCVLRRPFCEITAASSSTRSGRRCKARTTRQVIFDVVTIPVVSHDVQLSYWRLQLSVAASYGQHTNLILMREQFKLNTYYSLECYKAVGPSYIQELTPAAHCKDYQLLKHRVRNVQQVRTRCSNK